PLLHRFIQEYALQMSTKSLSALSLPSGPALVRAFLASSRQPSSALWNCLILTTSGSSPAGFCSAFSHLSRKRPVDSIMWSARFMASSPADSMSSPGWLFASPAFGDLCFLAIDGHPLLRASPPNFKKAGEFSSVGKPGRF